MNVVAVLKDGGPFKWAHGEFLVRQVRAHYPTAGVRLYSSFGGLHQLTKGLPRWWSKYEAYADPTLKGPCLVLDLDTVILAPWNPLPDHVDRDVLWRYPHPSLTTTLPPLGGIAYLQEDTRRRMAEEFFKDPIRCMAANKDDDQYMLRRHVGARAVYANQHYPDQVVTYKIHVQSLGLRPENRIVLFHGIPRPWDLDLPWIPKC